MLQAQMAQLPGASQQDQSETASIESIGMSFSTLYSIFQALNACIVDSGATVRLTYFLTFLSDFKPSTNKFVLLPNNAKFQVIGRGRVKLNEYITLHNVLHIPTFHVNLIFVPYLTPSRHIRVFVEDTFVLF